VQKVQPAQVNTEAEITVTLTELVAHLLRRRESAALELAHGPFELGAVIVHQGALWHAEVPGAAGEEAWALLQKVRNAAAYVRTLESAPPRTIDKELAGVELDAPLRDHIERRRQEHVVPLGGGADVPAPARVSHLSLPPVAVPDARTPRPVDVEQEAYEELFRAGTQAYLRHDFARALEAFTACAAMRPDDKRARHNIERLKTRMRPEGP
jgi:hypothetical protein